MLSRMMSAWPVCRATSAVMCASTQRASQLAARTEKSAQAMCQRIKGPNAAPRWTADGELTCVGTRGQAVSVAKVAP